MSQISASMSISDAHDQAGGPCAARRTHRQTTSTKVTARATEDARDARRGGTAQQQQDQSPGGHRTLVRGHLHPGAVTSTQHRAPRPHDARTRGVGPVVTRAFAGRQQTNPTGKDATDVPGLPEYRPQSLKRISSEGRSSAPAGRSAGTVQDGRPWRPRKVVYPRWNATLQPATSRAYRISWCAARHHLPWVA